MKYCANCGFQLKDEDVFCSSCGANFSATSNSTNPVSQTVPYSSSEGGLNFDFSNNTTTATPISNKRYEYKVLSQKDKWFSGKFDPMMLEQAINAYAQQGWRVIGCATADIPAFVGGQRQEFITLLEREV